MQPVVSPESPVLSPQSTLETATPTVQPTVAPVAPGANLNVTDLAATARIAEMPESVDTLNHQLDALRAGKRQAVLFTPGETVPKWAQDSDQYSTHETPAGTFLYDAAEITKDQIDEHVAKNTVGRLLGYGIDAKPAPADTIGAVTVRSAQGIEKQSVLTDKENLPGVLQAAQAMAAPGDTVRLESPVDVLNARAAAAAPKATPLTERQQMTQENVDAMNALAKLKESEETNAIDQRNKRGGVQPQREGGNAGGPPAETGSGDRLQREAEGAAEETAPLGAGLLMGERQSDNDVPDVHPDVIENWFNDAIEAVKPADWRNNFSMGIAKVPVWLTQEAAGLTLRAAKLAYTTTRDLSRAIGAGLEHLKSMGLQDFNEDEARRWLQDTIGQTRHRAEDRWPHRASRSSQARYHRISLRRRRAQGPAEEQANGIVARFGLDAAQETLAATAQ